MLDFLSEFEALQPEIFIVNEDGNTLDKQNLCAQHGVKYIVLKREPHSGLAPRSTTDLRAINQIPFRIDLAGGWLDQPFVSRHYPGSVITLSIEPTIDFNDRSGMASSTRHAAIELWGSRLPIDDLQKLAKILFCYDNPPGTTEISGSQDAIGIVYPGLAKADYKGEYWPDNINRLQDELTLQFLENALYLITLGPRQADYDVLANTQINTRQAKALADATTKCWQALQQKDIQLLGHSVRASFEAQIAMFPNMINDSVTRLIEKYKDISLGWKLSGAGGGGYLILVADKPIENAVRIVARREHD